MAMTWTDITNTSVSAGQPVTTSLATDLRDNDEANSDKPLALTFTLTVVSASASRQPTASGTYYAYCPEDSKHFRLRAAFYRSTGTGTPSCAARMSLASGGAQYVEAEQTTGATAKGSPGGSADITWDLSDLSNASGEDWRGQDVKLELFVWNSTTGATVILTTDSWPQCRFSHA